MRTTLRNVAAIMLLMRAHTAVVATIVPVAVQAQLSLLRCTCTYTRTVARTEAAKRRFYVRPAAAQQQLLIENADTND